MKEKIFEELEKRSNTIRKYGGWRTAGLDGIRKYPELAVAVNLLLLHHAIDKGRNKVKLAALSGEQLAEFQEILVSAGVSDEIITLQYC